MKKICRCRKFLSVALLGGVFSTVTASAQFFSFPLYGTTLLGFRKTGAHQGSYELVVNLGNITNFVGLAPGATINLTNYSATQLSDAFADGFQNLQWSVSAQFPGNSTWAGYPKYTVWYSLPSTNVSAQSFPPNRLNISAQSLLQKRMQGLGQGAVSISTGLGTTNSDNNAWLVREPYDPSSISDLTYFIGDVADPTIGDWGGQNFSFSVENTIPNTFSSAARLDLYQSVPSGYIDPTTGSTGPSSYLVGYFVLGTSGTMTFTRASAVAPPPPAPTLVSVLRAGNTSTVSFTTTNGATYTLYYTNAAGLSAPVSTWAASPTTVVGNGSNGSLSDTSTDPARFYRVGAR